MTTNYDIGDTDHIYEAIGKFAYVARIERSQLYATIIKMFLMMEEKEMTLSLEELEILGKKYYVVFSFRGDENKIVVTLREKGVE